MVEMFDPTTCTRILWFIFLQNFIKSYMWK